MLTRRHVIAAGSALALPRISRAETIRTLKFIPQSDVTVLDPSWTTAYVTRNHAMLVYDTLFATDANHAVSPQMLAGHTIEDDGKTWRLTLRDGLRFHDGTPVLGRDCVASIRRWGMRDNFGKTVAAVTDDMTAPDDRTIRIRLKQPFPLLSAALGKGGSSVCAIMPERLATANTAKPITEVVGSGPYRYVAAERNVGALVVYQRFDGYVPRPDGTPSFIAGPKIAHFDRIEWHVIPDQATAAAALQSGEVDWWEVPTTDFLPGMRKDPKLTVKVHDPTGFLGFLRFNHLTPPFNNPEIRRAVFAGIDQEAFMSALAGDNAALRHTGVGYFCPSSPMANAAGMDALTGPRDTAKVKAAIQAAGYRGEKVVILIPTDLPSLNTLGEVGADTLRRCGFEVDARYSDWGTVIQTLARADASQGTGWNIYHSFWSGLDQWDPAVNTSLRGLGRNGSPGWPTSPKIEALRDQWLSTQDLAEQKHLAQEIQLQAFTDVPYIPLGQAFSPMAYKKEITGVLDGYPLFWNVRRA